MRIINRWSCIKGIYRKIWTVLSLLLSYWQCMWSILVRFWIGLNLLWFRWNETKSGDLNQFNNLVKFNYTFNGLTGFQKWIIGVGCGSTLPKLKLREPIILNRTTVTTVMVTAAQIQKLFTKTKKKRKTKIPQPSWKK